MVEGRSGGGWVISELDDIKARAAERRDIWVGPDSDVGVIVGRIIAPAEADLDRVIAIAERFPLYEDVMKHYPTLRRMEEQSAEFMREREEARTAVDALRAEFVRKVPLYEGHPSHALLEETARYAYTDPRLDEARAAVLEFRSLLLQAHVDGEQQWADGLLTETEHYEQYRQQED